MEKSGSYVFDIDKSIDEVWLGMKRVKEYAYGFDINEELTINSRIGEKNHHIKIIVNGMVMFVRNMEAVSMQSLH